MKIMAVCGHGIGSSFMMDMNIKKVLKKLGVDAEVEHTDLASVNANDADLFVMANDIADSSGLPKDKILVIKNIVGTKELEEKLSAYFNQ
ncbi:PTS sugar transporter subunit IIB [Bisgaard Taxon 10/6]|uniref:PTS sugar transporter subunit IIB n=1 Tax=Exercitatus varius TaxID=67857 RepID=A0AAW6QC60_9PAST|nr:PTS sugar transporter subunit IIB [Exercitatus varius]MDG2916243.1 PTS sugar transporter subunit IIB [Exercitatus varius]MDG2918384.1 PTS sugar transporter subunit IIB [Exercitatus varius]MDG2940218.1 PTS sugar transporter subunit IIB [Exercitatus varius]MDG2942430.1 PTS sugar transporter subunit IIB [Exercitatus varius]MDG2944183.1 PTS sugar transporter subunit IIB [Exercitatus varius]